MCLRYSSKITDNPVMVLLFRYEAEDLAVLLQLELFTTSAKDNVNIESVFQHLANSYFKSPAVQAAPVRHYSPR